MERTSNPREMLRMDSLKSRKVKVKSSNIELFKEVTLPDTAASSVKMYDSRSLTQGLGPTLRTHCFPSEDFDPMAAPSHQCPGKWGCLSQGGPTSHIAESQLVFSLQPFSVIQLMLYVRLLHAKHSMKLWKERRRGSSKGAEELTF